MSVRIVRFGVLSILTLMSGIATETAWVQKPNGDFRPEIPKTWDDVAMAELEIPLADPVGSPKHVSADYYYRIPVRPIYKQYPIYGMQAGSAR